jgi:hypothetical protein
MARGLGREVPEHLHELCASHAFRVAAPAEVQAQVKEEAGAAAAVAEEEE